MSLSFAKRIAQVIAVQLASSWAALQLKARVKFVVDRIVPNRQTITLPILAFATLAACAALSGCGWHLQGSARLPASVTSIYLESDDPYSDFYRALRDSLVASGAQVQVPPQANAIVHIKLDKTGQRVASVSAKNKPEQYEVFYNVQYSVDVGGREAIPVQNAELTASYSYDASAVLAKQREQMSMQQSLARELAGQVVRRLASVGNGAE